MDKYQFLDSIGEGSFGSVWRAVHKDTSEIVAVKILKNSCDTWDDCLKLNEVSSSMHLKHPHIMRPKEVTRRNNLVFLVMELMKCNLFEFRLARGRSFSEGEIKNWCCQIFLGLAEMHRKGYIHRDLKPDNLLVSRDYTIKIGDLGLAIKSATPLPFQEGVAGTRWYRAPEMVFGSRFYDFKVDIWSMGVTMVELFIGTRLLPGVDDEDQMNRICTFLGTPTSWPEGFYLARSVNYQFPTIYRDYDLLPRLIPTASADAIDLIKSLCSWNPYHRPSAMGALKHPFFRSCFRVPASSPPPAQFQSYFHHWSPAIRSQPAAATNNVQRPQAPAGLPLKN